VVNSTHWPPARHSQYQIRINSRKCLNAGSRQQLAAANTRKGATKGTGPKQKQVMLNTAQPGHAQTGTLSSRSGQAGKSGWARGPEHMPDRMSEHMPEKMPDRISEWIPRRMPESICQKECQSICQKECHTYSYRMSACIYSVYFQMIC